MKSAMWIRLTAIGAVMVLAAVTLSICCTSAPIVPSQHGCCKDRCASTSATVPLVALAQAKHRLPVSTVAAALLPRPLTETSSLGVSAEESIRPLLFAPIATIQLRI